LLGEIGGRESGFAYFKEGDEVRVNDDAVLAPDTIRGEVGTVRKVNRFLGEPAQVSESLISVDRYQQLVLLFLLSILLVVNDLIQILPVFGSGSFIWIA